MKQITVDSPHNAFDFEVQGRRQKAHRTWFRGEHCNFNPTIANLRGQDSAYKHILAGWLPERPLIGPETRITAFGSCFAQNISMWLAERNFQVLTDKASAKENAYVIHFGEGMVNTFVILQQFQWAYEGLTLGEELWHGYKAEAYGYDEQVRADTRDLFDRTDVFVLTLGLSEIWYDEVTGGVFWRAIPEQQYDPARHKFRVASVEENKANLREMYRIIRRHRPDARIIFTLSPIPLVATFRPVSCITANAASKASLKAALDEILREVMDEGFAYYWPSYELVLDLFPWHWKADRRHVPEPILDFIMTLFECYWCRDSEPKFTLTDAWIRARIAASSLPPDLIAAYARGNVAYLAQVREYFLKHGNTEDAALILERAAEVAPNYPAVARWLTEQGSVGG